MCSINPLKAEVCFQTCMGLSDGFCLPTETPRTNPVAPPPQVFLLQALLRGHPYPRTQAAFDALAKAGKPWVKFIAAPLVRIADDPLFRVYDEWMLPQFQPQLAGKKVPMPRATSVESMLCTHGNRRATWHAIFECGEITSRQVCIEQPKSGLWLRLSCLVENAQTRNEGTRHLGYFQQSVSFFSYNVFDHRSRRVLSQVLRNVVDLAMMDFLVEVVKTQLLNSIDRAPMGNMLKAFFVFAEYLLF